MSLSGNYRAKAAEQREAVAPLFTTEKLVDPKNRVMVTVGQCNATIFDALADVVDFIDGKQKLARMNDMMKAKMELSNALRTAATAGDWDKFSELVAGLTDADGGAPGGTTA